MAIDESLENEKYRLLLLDAAAKDGDGGPDDDSAGKGGSTIFPVPFYMPLSEYIVCYCVIL